MSRKGLVRVFAAVVLTALAGVLLALKPEGSSDNRAAHIVETQLVAAGAQAPAVDEPGDDAGMTETFWSDRVTYPNGQYDAAWLRRAARQEARVGRNVPAGEKLAAAGASGSTSSGATSGSPTTASDDAGIVSATGLLTSSFVPLGPKPEKMSGCSGCYDYTTTSGRINSIVVDPRTSTPGSIVAYAASDGGGVWKTTTCCTATTTWAPVTDSPLIATISIDSLTLDPSNPDTVYAATGDLNYGSFSMGSQGILKSTDAGATWTTLGSTVFGPAYTQPTGKFPQYDSVGKVRVDPNSSSRVVAGTKKGLFFSYNGGTSWTGPCVTNSATTQRQDITGLELTDMGGGVTRILAAVGARGYATPVQFDLDQNGANGIYVGTMGTSGCPSFTSTASNSNGFTFGPTAITNTAYAANANLNAGSGAPFATASPVSGNQLGRIDLAVAPSNPDVIYAQVQSISTQTNSGCGSAKGCQLGAWASINGGATWTFMTGSNGSSLRACSGATGSSTAGSGDYPQNWYDQGIAVDPNNADRVFFDTFDVWLATRTGTNWYDLTCGYNGTSAANHVVHTDQHALAFANSSSALILGNDGGAHFTANANAAADGLARPTWINLDGGFNTIEFYDGDLGPNFATNPAPTAAGAAQDNMDSFVTFAGTPTGPQQWQGNIGGDGFYAAIDGKGGYVYASNNNGALHRCTANCSNTGSVFGGELRASTMRGDRQSFAEPFELFRGNPGGAGNAECAGTRCNHLMVGTYRIWESVNIDATTGVAWTSRTGDLTKNTLVLGTDNRSYINQLHYAPSDQTLGIVATNDGNVQFLKGLGGAAGTGATAINVTDGNTVLPNRPILDASIDPTSTNTAANPLIGYAAVGGFEANTPSTPGHVYRVVCDVDCAHFTWTDKSGNLPDIPVDSIVANPKVPQQVFAGTDFGLYFTNDITAASPTWYRFANGMSNAMVWSLTIDRGNSTLGVWTRSRGAYAWPLTTAAIKQNQTISFASIDPKTYGDPDFPVAAAASSGLPVSYATTGPCSVSGGNVNVSGAGTCTITASQAGNIDFNPATDTIRSFTIAKAAQTIDFPSIDAKTYGDPDFTLGAVASSGLAVSYDTTGNCQVAGGTLHITGAGTCHVTAAQPGNDDYEPATTLVQDFGIAKAKQTLEVGATDDKTFGDDDFELTATSSSGLAVVLTVTAGPCTLSSPSSPAHVHIAGAGACLIAASQAGDANYEAATEITRSFAIAKGNQTIVFGALGAKTYRDADFDVSATASSGLAVSFVAAGACTVSGASVHITGAGECTITASQTGDADHNPAPDVSQTFAIAKASQEIDFASIDDKTFGDDDFTVAPAASSGLAVALAATGQCEVNDSVVRILGAGACTITASQPGSADYNAASDVVRTFAIGKEAQTIGFAELADRTYGDEDFYVAASASSGLDVVFTATGNCSLVYGKVSLSGAGSCTVTAAQEGNDNFKPADSISRTFAIAKSAQTITFQAVNDKTFGTSDFEIDATSSSGLVVGLRIASGPCTLSGSLAPATVKITAAGTCVVEASQGGNDNYKSAPNVTRSFSIGKANQTIAFGSLGAKTYGDPDFGISATSTSGLTVAFTAIGDCAVASGIVHITGGGLCTIRATQSGNANYNPAADVERSFAIAKKAQTITFGALANHTFGDADFSIGASASSGLAVLFGAAGSCTVSGTTVHISGVNVCTVTAAQPGNGNYEPAPSVTQTFSVSWPFGGFLSPVDAGALNDAKAGSAIPLKFSLGGDRGLAIFANGAPKIVAIACDGSGGTGAGTDAGTPGGSGLSYGGGQYTYVWKTDKALAGTCQQLQLTLADGSDRKANFRFK